ncbi:MAG: divergent polysaccharide deacetylase family protein [Calditrichaeota bacterium]|nr:divergent polysaccharide deacetylase family protein [Calditrichota bacterium]
MRRRRTYRRPRPRRRKIGYLLLIGALVLVVLIVSGRHRRPGAHSQRKTPSVAELRSAVLHEAARHGIGDQHITSEGQWLVLSVPGEKSVPALAADIARTAQAMGATVEHSEQTPAGGSARLVLRLKGQVALRLRIQKASAADQEGPLIALVIDDFGYSAGELAKELLSLPYALTVSVIPGLPFSAHVAELAAAAGKEVMVHMPMEALHEAVEDRGYTLFVHLSDEEIRQRVDSAIATVPHAAGLNNHQGSRATADERVMTIVMQELKERGLYFVDSRTNSMSIAHEVASRMQVPCTVNATFLDVEADTAKVRQQLWRLAHVAKRQGRALGIGHLRRTTLEALRQEVPKLQQQGYQFVTVSRLLRVSPPIAWHSARETDLRRLAQRGRVWRTAHA